MSTPAPWSWEYHPDFKHAIALVSDATDVLLVTNDADENIYAQMTEADAQLIASAPDLLAGCHAALEMRAMLSASFTLETLKDRSAAWNRVIELTDTIRAAIGKATGEHP